MKLSTVVIAGLFLAPAAGLSAQGINDAQIASIVVTANQVDIDAGKLATTQASNPEVKKFGQQMVTDHTGVNKQATELVTKLKVTPQDNPTSQALKKKADAQLASQAKLSGAAFDRAYAANEVAYHKTVNSALQKTLIPDAKNAELKSLLQTGLKLFTEHQHHAEELAAKIK